MWLITGANGQLGQCMQRVLTQSNIPFVAYNSADLNITVEAQLEQVFSEVTPKVVVNAAAYTAVDKAESELELAKSVNTYAPGYLARLCGKYNAQLIHVSTDYVFDGHANHAYHEQSPTAPQSVYGQTKLEGEYQVLENAEAIVIRTAWVFSEFGNNFVKTMARLAKEKDSLGVVADQVGCPTYAGDIALAILKLAQRRQEGLAGPGIYHYCGDVAVSWWSFARFIHHALLLSGEIEQCPVLSMLTTAEYPTPAKRPGNSVLDCSRVISTGISLSDWRSQVVQVLERLKG